MARFPFIFSILAAFAIHSAAAFDPPAASDGNIEIVIGNPGNVRAGGKYDIPVTITNSGSTETSGKLRAWVIDGWKISGSEAEFSRALQLRPKETITVPLAVTAADDSYSALYPVHAKFESNTGSPHAVLILQVGERPPPDKPETVIVDGAVHLDNPAQWVTMIFKGKETPRRVGSGWTGDDPETGASVRLLDIDRGGQQRAIGMHPPYRVWPGDLALEFRVDLRHAPSPVLQFSTAMRDLDPENYSGDGVVFIVLVKEGEDFQPIFSRFSKSNVWEPASVDLSKYSGKEIMLRVLTSPGAGLDTTCDQSYWGGLTIYPSPPASPKVSGPGSFSIDLGGGRKAALEVGKHGLCDARIELSDGGKSLNFEGFDMQVGGYPLKEGWAINAVRTSQDAEGITIDHEFKADGQVVTARARLWGEKGTLRVAFSMPGTFRDHRGDPRFTRLAIGPASSPVERVFAGLGNVLVKPGRLRIPGNGFQLSTRHTGVDYSNGLSVLQASDVFPDAFVVDPDERIASLESHNDATFTLIPSSEGAFATARGYRQIAGYKPAAGVANLQGRMCLDQWDGDYAKAAEDVRLAAAYGLTDTVFVKHVWQRWGYDYRLPDIYPPSGSAKDFLAMVEACRESGILFAPHDNYIDFYPDAAGYSYDHIVFQADGSPQKAWLNEGRGAQSYRWVPTAFTPWQKENLEKMKLGVAPTALFIDVFSALAPFDFYDREGNFHPLMETQREWGAAFDRARDAFGSNAPQISEAGTDALIGHLDAAQSDHAGWFSPDAPPVDKSFRWTYPAQDGERIPWHDMVTHGNFILFAGGLGGRYAGGQNELLHGYGSDDYLSLTVLGGRNPMCDGPFNRRAVMTYWLLHDICAKLGAADMMAHEFVGGDIHRQRVAFSGGEVFVNRGKTDWEIDGHLLPQYGFVAKSGDVEASIEKRNGVICAMSRAPGTVFVDSRPASPTEGQVLPQVLGVEADGRKVRVRVRWELLGPVDPAYRPFFHFTKTQPAGNDDIAFQGNTNFPPDSLSHAGVVETTFEAEIPQQVKDGDSLGLRFGFYNPANGRRLPLLGAVSEGRAIGGDMKWSGGRVTFDPPIKNVSPTERLNPKGTVVDFGGVATNGAFRMEYSKLDWQLTPLPDSLPFEIRLTPAKIAQNAGRVESIEAIAMDGSSLGPVSFDTQGSEIRFRTAEAFAYLIRFAKE
jgi:hypothetical protein